MTDPGSGFDRDFALRELLQGISLDALASALSGLLGPQAGLSDARGETLCGEARGTAPTASLYVEFEAVGSLSGAPAERLNATKQLVDLLLDARRRYLMVCDLHTEAIAADYLELQKRHAELQASEQRYRNLTAQLEQRVGEQVAIIEGKQRQLYEAEKLASIGQLAAGVAHEINNPIGFVRSNLSTAQGYVERLDEFAALLRGGANAVQAWDGRDLDFMLEDFKELLRESTEGIDRVARIVKDLKGFSSVDRPDEEVVNLNDNLESVCALVSGQIPQGVALLRHFGELPPLLCLPGHLNQVFLNLLNNALQAVGGKGDVTVSSELREGEILVRIADTGPGMEAPVAARIFEPFFTTREVGRGTGLGLTVARDIVQAHGGHIEVSTAPGAGAAFTVRLPV